MITACLSDANTAVRWGLVPYLIQKFDMGGKSTAFITVILGVLLSIVIPYLIGSVNFALVFSKRLFHDDVREHGSGNAGSTNMLRTYGIKAALFTLLCDFLKGVVAVVIGYCIESAICAPIAGLFVILGHVFPVFFKFKGGKGIACLAGVVLVFNPLVFAILLLIYIVLFLLFRYISLCSIIGALFFPLLLRAFEPSSQGGTKLLMAVLMSALIIFMHRKNIERLLNKKEPKTTFGKKHAFTEGAENENTEKSKKYSAEDFTECTGCGHLIPVTRKKCAYCNTENKSYKPNKDTK